VAKKKTPRRPPAESDEAARIDETVEQAPKVRKAADAVQRAKDELFNARKMYAQVRDQAVEKLKGAREMRVGELIDGTLDAVKRHPGLGVIVAAVIGFFFGRLFRR